MTALTPEWVRDQDDRDILAVRWDAVQQAQREAAAFAWDEGYHAGQRAYENSGRVRPTRNPHRQGAN